MEGVGGAEEGAEFAAGFFGLWWWGESVGAEERWGDGRMTDLFPTFRCELDAVVGDGLVDVAILW